MLNFGGTIEGTRTECSYLSLASVSQDKAKHSQSWWPCLYSCQYLPQAGAEPGRRASGPPCPIQYSRSLTSGLVYRKVSVKNRYFTCFCFLVASNGPWKGSGSPVHSHQLRVGSFTLVSLPGLGPENVHGPSRHPLGCNKCVRRPWGVGISTERLLRLLRCGFPLHPDMRSPCLLGNCQVQRPLAVKSPCTPLSRDPP